MLATRADDRPLNSDRPPAVTLGGSRCSAVGDRLVGVQVRPSATSSAIGGSSAPALCPPSTLPLTAGSVRRDHLRN